MKVLLDTCAILWVILEPQKISSKVQKILTQSEMEIIVSPISCAEIACGVEKERITLDRHWKKWFRYFVTENGWQSAEITLDVIEEAYALPEPMHRDPADRIIVATARLLRIPIITGDKLILAYPHVETMWE